MNQFFNVIKVIIISNNSLPMVNDSVVFIFFKAVQQGFNTISFGKYSKSIRLDFCQKAFLAIHFTKIAVFYTFFNRTTSILAPFFIRAIT